MLMFCAAVCVCVIMNRKMANGPTLAKLNQNVANASACVIWRRFAAHSLLNMMWHGFLDRTRCPPQKRTADSKIQMRYDNIQVYPSVFRRTTTTSLCSRQSYTNCLSSDVLSAMFLCRCMRICVGPPVCFGYTAAATPAKPPECNNNSAPHNKLLLMCDTKFVSQSKSAPASSECESLCLCVCPFG